jgi:hypothetical protein
MKIALLHFISFFVSFILYLAMDSEKKKANELKYALIKSYHCLIFASNDHETINYKLASHFSIIYTFVLNTCDIKYAPSVVIMLFTKEYVQ